ncbi:Acyl-homoserine lactone acylase QuiP [subsurface metagenome]
MGKKLEEWKWEDLHKANFRNQTLGESGIKFVESIFNRGPIAVRGGNLQVSVASWGIDKPFKVTWIASMRQIVDLSDLSKSLMMHTTGQSGHPGHSHYDDFIEPWRLLEYHPTRWNRADVEAESGRKLILAPAQ